MADNATIKVVRITSKRDGFRRCGIAHSAKAVDYPITRFRSGELKRLQDEPMLVVQVLEVPAPKVPGA